jgi:hypothetical protein
MFIRLGAFLQPIVILLYQHAVAEESSPSCNDDSEGDTCILLQRQPSPTLASLPAEAFVRECIINLPRWSSKPKALQDICERVLPDSTCEDVFAILDEAPWTEQAATAVCGNVRSTLVARGAPEGDIRSFGSELLKGDRIADLLEGRAAKTADIDYKGLDSAIDLKPGGKGKNTKKGADESEGIGDDSEEDDDDEGRGGKGRPGQGGAGGAGGGNATNGTHAKVVGGNATNATHANVVGGNATNATHANPGKAGVGGGNATNATNATNANSSNSSELQTWYW